MGTEHLRARATRNQVLMKLGVGSPYPLQDVLLADRSSKVPYGDAASLVFPFSEQSVVYKFTSTVVDQADEGKQIQLAPQAGTGEALTIPTPPVEVAVYVAVTADRQIPSKEVGQPSTTLTARLHHRFTIRVGLDDALAAEIVGADLLSTAYTGPTAPRVIDYNRRIAVRLEATQTNVYYRLFRQPLDTDDPAKFVAIDAAPVEGTGGDIILRSNPIRQDGYVRIQASTSADARRSRGIEVCWLETRLPLAVRARPDVEFTIAPEVAPYADSQLRLTVATENSVFYSVFRRALRDGDYRHENMDQRNTVEVTGVDFVKIAKPDQRTLPHGFEKVNLIRGNGKRQTISLDHTQQDELFIIQAVKQHDMFIMGNTRPISAFSTIYLNTMRAVLIEPNPAPGLHLRIQVNPVTDTTEHELMVLEGEPGVFYQFQVGDTPVDERAYVHRTYPNDPETYLGLGQMRLEVDFAVTRAPLADESDNQPPARPIVTIPNWPIGTQIAIRAIRAYTRVAVDLTESAVIDPLPVVIYHPASGSRRSSGTITISGASDDEDYQILLNGRALPLSPIKANGTITVEVPRLVRGTTLVFSATRTSAAGLRVERWHPVAFQVRDV